MGERKIVTIHSYRGGTGKSNMTAKYRRWFIQGMLNAMHRLEDEVWEYQAFKAREASNCKFLVLNPHMKEGTALIFLWYASTISGRERCSKNNSPTPSSPLVSKRGERGDMRDPTEQKVATGVEEGAQAQEPGAASSAALRHELRQPLNHILGYSELLLEEAKGRELESFSADLQKIHTAANTLLALIDSVVVSSKHESGSLSPVPNIGGDGSQQRTDRVPASVGHEVTARSFGHLMVVDDDDVNRNLLSRRLRQQGYQVSVAEDGHRALELMQTQPVDLVLLDVLMPEMDGFTTCERLKADPGTQESRSTESIWLTEVPLCPSTLPSAGGRGPGGSAGADAAYAGARGLGGRGGREWAGSA